MLQILDHWRWQGFPQGRGFARRTLGLFLFQITRAYIDTRFVTSVASELTKKSKVSAAPARRYLLRSYEYNGRNSSTPVPQVNEPIRRDTWRRRQTTARPNARPLPKRQINHGHAADLAIPLVARAATAAVCYFEPVEIRIDESLSMLFEDGGFGAENNPTQVGLEEIQGLHGQDRVGAVVSVGTARSDAAQATEKGRIDRIAKKAKSLADLATSPEKVHDDLLHRANLKCYERLNPELDKHRVSVPFDEWLPRTRKRRRFNILRRRGEEITAGSTTIDEIRRRFDSYLATSEVQQQLRRIAEELVDRRQARAEMDGSRWEQYAIGSEFMCNEPQGSHDCHKRFSLRRELEAHLRDVHNFSADTIRRVASQPRSKTWFRYQQNQ